MQIGTDDYILYTHTTIYIYREREIMHVTRLDKSSKSQ